MYVVNIYRNGNDTTEFFTVITLQNIIKESLTLINTKNLCVGSVIFIIINQSETYHIQLL